MSELKNIDTILVQSMQEQATNSPTQPTVEPSIPEQPAVSSSPDEPPLVAETAQAESDEVLRETPEETPQVEDEKPQVSDKSPIDEYGNPVAPAKTYTEDEVQRMMRERLARVKQPDPVHTPAVSQPAPEEGEQDWRQELKTFVKQTLGEVTQEEQQAQWRHQESQRQADFESKFNVGMAKYQDFHSVVANKPITKDMMLATRSLDNPAAFIYGASKLHPQELGRIAEIADPYQQAAEIGRLHEKMVRTHNGVSNIPKPITPPKGDLPNKKVNDRPSIDTLIVQHAEQKNKRR